MSSLFCMWMPGWQELLIVLAIALVLFGSRLPKTLFSIGQSLKEFRRGMNDSEQTPAADK